LWRRACESTHGHACTPAYVSAHATAEQSSVCGTRFGGTPRNRLSWRMRLAQVHRAVYKGTPVAVKVQRAGLKELFDTDLKNLKVLVKLLDKFDPKCVPAYLRGVPCRASRPSHRHRAGTRTVEGRRRVAGRAARPRATLATCGCRTAAWAETAFDARRAQVGRRRPFVRGHL
jgi:hypothetical protein